MLRIRQEQLDALQADRDRPLVEWIASQLRVEHAKALVDVSDSDLGEGVKKGLATAR